MMKLVAQIQDHVYSNPQLAAGQLAAIASGLVNPSFPSFLLYLQPLPPPAPKLPGSQALGHDAGPLHAQLLHGPGALERPRAARAVRAFVRVAPDIVSVSHPDALVQLQGHRTKGKAENQKDDVIYWQMKGNIVGANREDHARVRRVMSNGFSAQAMMEQQPLIQRYVDLLLSRLRDRCDDGRTPLDVTQWYNWATFDLVGDLAFGEPFDCLEQGQYHPWVTLIFESMLTMGNIAVLRRFGYGVGNLLAWCFIPRALARKMQEHNALSAVKVERRLGRQAERGDLIGKMLSGSRKQGSVGLTHFHLRW
ncbi:Trichothecene C-15 hydroxylase [Apiospora hydei]|uniref:Trichothecene C-15 hydroxylase n=1 Tax=Apiospora hydei TaxID=1337664 RepID=A0ABR1XEF5_9PEZI